MGDPIDILYDNRSDPEHRAVLEDWERSRYRTSTVARLGYALSFIHAVGDVDAADAAAAAAADIRSIRELTSTLVEEPNMEEGLKILQIQITNWRAITFVGWLRRVSGDEYLLIGARIITRKRGQPWSWNGIAELAEKGPGDRYQLAPIMKQPEELHRLGSIRRSKPADEKVWAKHCPRPKDWSER